MRNYNISEAREAAAIPELNNGIPHDHRLNRHAIESRRTALGQEWLNIVAN
jgi:hypothetical protein